MQWCRLYVEITRDPKTARLPDGAFRLFVELLALASEAEAGGDTKLTREDIDWTLRRPACEFLDELARRGLAGVSPGGTVFVVNWGKRQFRSDDSSERVRALRERERNGDVTATKRSGNALDTETEKKQNRTEKDGAQARLPDWLPAEAWEAFLEMRKKIRKAPTDRAKELLLKQLGELKAKGYDPRTVLDNSTRNNWQDLYEPRQGGKIVAPPKPAKPPSCVRCPKDSTRRLDGDYYCDDHKPIERATLPQVAALAAAKKVA